MRQSRKFVMYIGRILLTKENKQIKNYITSLRFFEINWLLQNTSQFSRNWLLTLIKKEAYPERYPIEKIGSFCKISRFIPPPTNIFPVWSKLLIPEPDGKNKCRAVVKIIPYTERRIDHNTTLVFSGIPYIIILKW